MNERTGRDGRLLALVIVVSLAVLLVLARFRFAASDGAPTPTGPLERIVARSTYEDLAATIGNLVQRLSPSVVVLIATPIPPEAKPAAPGKKTTEPRPSAPVAPLPPRLVAAVRVGQDLMVGHVPAGYQVTGGQGLSGPVEVVAFDAARGIAIVKATSVLDAAIGTVNPHTEFAGFSYVAVVEAATGGITASPMFIGRADPRQDGQWPTPIRLLGGTPVVPIGALVFALDLRFIGLVIEAADGARLLIPSAAIDATVLTLTSSGKGSRP